MKRNSSGAEPARVKAKGGSGSYGRKRAAVAFKDGTSSAIAVDRPLAVLQAVATAPRSLTLAQLQTELKLPKPTLHRLCSRLADSAFLLRDLDARGFVVGPALRSLALNVLNNNVIRGLRHAILAEVVEEVGETCNLTTLDGVEVLYLDRVEARWPLRLSLEVGTRVPIHCTASGKLFLAHLPEKALKAILEKIELKRLTPATLVNAARLEDELQTIRDQGYSMDQEEFIAGLIGVAVPIFDNEGKIRAAVAIHAPTIRMTPKAAIARLPQLREAAAKIRDLV